LQARAASDGVAGRLVVARAHILLAALKAHGQ
jgi:hypothetical protein